MSGEHYARTLEEWLRRYDERPEAVRPLLVRTYGAEGASLWQVDWRLFFIACAESFGYAGGREWGLSHYLLAPR